VGVVVFDSDVLIGFLNRDDVQHERAVQVMREAWTPTTTRHLCAVNYTEILIGPLKVGAQEQVKVMITRFAINIAQVDMALAERAAAVRARTGLKVPDAYALATAVHLEQLGRVDVKLASFDGAVARAHAALHPDPDGPGGRGMLAP
jgi:predicted nucleic acid-binding protein